MDHPVGIDISDISKYRCHPYPDTRADYLVKNFHRILWHLCKQEQSTAGSPVVQTVYLVAQLTFVFKLSGLSVQLNIPIARLSTWISVSLNSVPGCLDSLCLIGDQFLRNFVKLFRIFKSFVTFYSKFQSDKFPSNFLNISSNFFNISSNFFNISSNFYLIIVKFS